MIIKVLTQHNTGSSWQYYSILFGWCDGCHGNEDLQKKSGELTYFGTSILSKSFEILMEASCNCDTSHTGLGIRHPALSIRCSSSPYECEDAKQLWNGAQRQRKSGRSTSTVLCMQSIHKLEKIEVTRYIIHAEEH